MKYRLHYYNGLWWLTGGSIVSGVGVMGIPFMRLEWGVEYAHRGALLWAKWMRGDRP